MSDTRWNFDISKAPRGSYSMQEFPVKGKIHKREVFIHDTIIVATKCGMVMTSRWLPDKKDSTKGRWLGLHSKGEPVAWQPFEKHPYEQDNESA